MVGAYRDFSSWIDDDITVALELGSRDLLDAIWLVENLDCKVVSWECNPLTLETCRSNLLGREHSIELVEKAVWSRNEEITFRPVINGNIGASSVFKADTSYPHEKPLEQIEIKVQAMRVDDWWKNTHFPKPELLCMDLQGAEMEALEGMGDVIDSVKYVITEGQYKQIYHNTPLIGDIEKFLISKGFSMKTSTMFNDYFGDFLFIRD